MDKIGVLIIEDSAFMRKMITDILSSDERIHVLGTARNGEEGLKKVKSFSPDVVTLDVEMPVLDGLETLKVIMNENPLPVIMLSSLTPKGANKTIQAMSIGAVDFVTKPSGAISLDIEKSRDEIISKVVTASKINFVNKMHSFRKPLKKIPEQLHKNTLVVIGTSTGGPRALQQVLTSIPIDFPSPILIVQHMPANFTKSLADRLNMLSKIEVREATHGEIIEKGVAYIAPGDYHMIVRKSGMALTIELNQNPLVNGHRPSVDVLFNSVAKLKRYNKLAVILTGMGRDGAMGLKKIKEANDQSIILAESEESSVVYGMPAAAVETGCVNQVVHLHKIGKMINEIVSQPRRP